MTNITMFGTRVRQSMDWVYTLLDVPLVRCLKNGNKGQDWFGVVVSNLSALPSCLGCFGGDVPVGRRLPPLTDDLELDRIDHGLDYLGDNLP